VTYRLDYGASVRIGGQLDLSWPFEGRPRLRGELMVERATLRRNIALDREVLRSILEPESLTDNPFLHTIDLGVTVTTTLSTLLIYISTARIGSPFS